MTNSKILGHIVKYKLPSLIQSSPMWHRSQLQYLLTMVNEFGMPHF
jgi:ATP-dependent DNA helicase PIF1